MICNQCGNASEIEVLKRTNPLLNEMLDVIHCEDLTNTKCFCQHKTGHWSGDYLGEAGTETEDQE